MASRSLYLIAGAVLVAAIIAAAYYAASSREAGTAAKTVTVTTTATVTRTVTRTVATGATGTWATAAGTATTKPARELLVYVYEDFMAWGEDPKLFDKLVENFTRETGIKVVLRKFKGARSMVAQVIAEKRVGARTADVVVGVDPLLLSELKARGLVECYASPQAPAQLVRALDPEGCATPVDYGLIALVYDPSRLNETEKAMLRDGVTLDELVKLAPRLVVEDPTQSSTGLNFLLYTIAVSRMEGRDWKQLWKQLKSRGVMVAPSWGDAYDEFYREGSPRAIVVSYGTDPAYSAWYNARKGRGEKPSIEATVLVANGSRVGWVQVEGAAVIKGAPLEEARRFVDWLLSHEVQDRIPTSQWMMPVRGDARLPGFYRYAMGLGSVDTLANTGLRAGPGELEEWLRDWLLIMSG